MDSELDPFFKEIVGAFGKTWMRAEDSMVMRYCVKFLIVMAELWLCKRMPFFGRNILNLWGMRPAA